MKNKTQLSYSNQPTFIFESATVRIRPDSPPTAFIFESVKAVFPPPLLSYSNTYIDLAMGRGAWRTFYSPEKRAFRARGHIRQISDRLRTEVKP